MKAPAQGFGGAPVLSGEGNRWERERMYVAAAVMDPFVADSLKVSKRKTTIPSYVYILPPYRK